MLAVSGFCRGVPVFSQVMDDLKKMVNLATCSKQLAPQSSRVYETLPQPPFFSNFLFIPLL